MPDAINVIPKDVISTETKPNGMLEYPAPGDCFKSVVPNYALLFFDHHYSEYLTLRSKIEDQQVLSVLEAIHNRRTHCQMTWSDIYTFDLALVDFRPLESLIRKAYDARAKYRNIAGQKEYDEYLASKPPDLTTILITPSDEVLNGNAAMADSDQASAVPATARVAPAVALAKGDSRRDDNTHGDVPKSLLLIQRVLRADIKYLLSKFYLYYSMLPVREGMRDELTNRAVTRTLMFVGALVFLMLINLGFIFSGKADSSAGLTVLTVAMAGIMGGCVSMLQRIQSAPSEGDALFNLAALNNGWRGLSLSPLYGGIFASLLFVLFAAGVLKGSVFPVIHTPTNQPAAQAAPIAPAATSTTTAAPAAAAAHPDLAVNATPEPSEILRIREFLKETGPADGVAYALLIIWSFLAGFLERLVPDTLNRLVAKNQALQGTNA